MSEIKLTKRYPHSRSEDITDAYTRGFEDGMKMGRGVCHNTVDESWGTFECSECGTQWEVAPVYIGPCGTSDHDLVIPNYCPNCGAKVVGA